MIASRAIPAVVVVAVAALGPLASARDLAPASAFDVDDVVFGSGFDGEIGFFLAAGRGAAADTAFVLSNAAPVVGTGFVAVAVSGLATGATVFFGGVTPAPDPVGAALLLSAFMTPAFALLCTPPVVAGFVFAAASTLLLPSSRVLSVDAILAAVGLVDDGPSSVTCTRAAFGPGVLVAVGCCCW